MLLTDKRQPSWNCTLWMMLIARWAYSWMHNFCYACICSPEQQDLQFNFTRKLFKCPAISNVVFSYFRLSTFHRRETITFNLPSTDDIQWNKRYIPGTRGEELWPFVVLMSSYQLFAIHTNNQRSLKRSIQITIDES